MRKLQTLLLVALMTVAATGCSDDETDLGVSLVDSEALYHGIHDTLWVDNAYTVRNDSLATTQLSYGLVGSYDDANLGTTTATLYTQIAPMSNEVNLEHYTIDSVVLCLTLATPRVLPDSNRTYNFHLKITQLQEAITDTTYYSYSTLPTNEAMVVYDNTISVGPTDTTLTLRLNSAFNSQMQLSATKADFIAQTKGLQITILRDDPSQDGMLVVNFNATNTVVKAYYNNTYTRFSIGSQANRFIHFAHDYSTTPLGSNDSIDASNLIYIGAMAGTKGRISFRTAIDNFRAAHPRAIIHHAELHLPLNTAAGTEYSKRVLASFFSNGKEYFVFDMSRDAVPFKLFDGWYNSSTNAYRLRIPQHVQYLLREPSANASIDLQVSDRLESPYSTVVNGPNGSEKAYISFIYTE